MQGRLHKKKKKWEPGERLEENEKSTLGTVVPEQPKGDVLGQAGNDTS